MANSPFEIRPARDEDRLPLALVFAAVAEERDGIGTEPPVDVEARAASWTLASAPAATATARSGWRSRASGADAAWARR